MVFLQELAFSEEGRNIQKKKAQGSRELKKIEKQKKGKEEEKG